MSETGHIPYEATARAEVDAAGTDAFMERNFPQASQTQMEQLQLYIAGLVHNGIETGLACSDENPISPLEAYKLGAEEGHENGFKDGYEQAMRELGRGNASAKTVK